MANASLHPLINSAFTHLQCGEAAQASALLTQLLALQANNPTAHFLQGAALYQLGQKKDALKHFDRATKLHAQYTDAFYNRGTVEAELGLLKQAELSFKRTLALKPDYYAVYANLGAVLVELGRPDDAVAAFSRLVAAQPNDPQAVYNRGTVLLTLEKPDLALADLQKAVALKPDYVAALSNLALVLSQLGRFEEAISTAQKVLSYNETYGPAHLTLMSAFLALRKLDDALRHADRAVALAPQNADAHVGRGDVLRARADFVRAIESYDVAIALRPKHGPSYVCRADAYENLKELDKASADYDAAAALQPFDHFALGYALSAHAQLCAWDGMAAQMPVLHKGIKQARAVSTPFSLLALPVSAHEQLQSATMMAQRVMSVAKSTVEMPRPTPSDKIRLGYFSPDFRNHAVSNLMAGVFEAHDRTKFDVIGFSYGPATHDAVYERVKSGVDQFIDITAHTPQSAAALARSLNLDIAVDLAGYTGQGRPEIFANRAAPAQVNYLGYPATMGSGFIDYIIADNILVPEGAAKNYGEKIVYMPECFQANDDKRVIGLTPTRSDYGLADDQFVFCSFNNTYKITEAMFRLWLDILRQTEKSVLWLVESNRWHAEHMRAYAVKEGIDPARLVFAQNRPYAEHLARYQLADLVLDTLPFNGGTTTSDALWGGVPVLTCTGETFAGRMATSLLTAMELPELIAASLSDYVKMAVDLRHDAARLCGCRQRIADNRMKSALFNTARFTRHLEKAFIVMTERARGRQPADHIYIQAEPQ